MKVETLVMVYRNHAATICEKTMSYRNQLEMPTLYAGGGNSTV